MSLLLTGAYGFIGSRVARRFLSRGEHNLLLSDSIAHASRPCAKGFDVFSFVDRQDLFEELPSREGITAVLHLGACTDTGQTDQAYMDRWNTDYTKRLWAWCVEQKVPLVYASSAATYGKGEAGYSDDHSTPPKLKPLNLYGRSKNDFDLWALGQKKTPPHWTGLKFFNVYGMDESHKGRMASPVFHGFNEIARTGRQTLFQSHQEGVADGEQKRDFIFVEDIVDLCLFHVEKRPPPGIYNCGTGEARSFLDLSMALFKALGKEPAINWVPTPEKYRAGYQYFTQAEMAKTRKAGFLGTFLPLERGVQKYVEWLQKNSL